MGPPVDPVEASQSLPKETEVAVIGGGIIGVSTAFFLARRGIPVVLCEKGHVAGEQSSRNWGWCRAMGRDPRELQLAIESVALWRGMNEMVGGETGFRQNGTVYLCDTPEAVAKREAWLPHARKYQLDSRILSSAEVDALFPGGTRRWAGALYTPSDGVAEPQKAAPAIANAARRLGAAIVTNCAVRGVETAAGRIAAVVTEHGRVACRSVVLAGGAWSRLFCRSLGIRLPQLKVLGSVLRTAPLADGPLANGPLPAAWGPGVAFRKRLDGGYTIAEGSVIADIVPDSFRFFMDFLPALKVQRAELRLRLGGRFVEEWRLPQRWSLDETSPFERVRTLDPVPDERVLEKGLAGFRKLFPALAGVAKVQSWAGLIDVTPDVMPVISPVETLPGFFVATGFSGHGFGIGPAAGRLMSDLVLGETPSVDPAPFRLSRFSDGSPVQPLCGI